MGRFLVGEPDAGFSEVGAELVTLGNRGFKGALGVGLLPGQVGDLLVIPVGKSLLYVQPLYLKAEQGELPELKRVIVSTGGRVAWAETFGEALEKLMGQKVVSGVGTQTVVTDEAKGVASVAVSADNVEPSANLARQAQEYYDAAQKAQRSGDWAKYGEYIRKLGDVIARMQGGK